MCCELPRALRKTPTNTDTDTFIFENYRPASRQSLRAAAATTVNVPIIVRPPSRQAQTQPDSIEMAPPANSNAQPESIMTKEQQEDAQLLNEAAAKKQHQADARAYQPPALPADVIARDFARDYSWNSMPPPQIGRRRAAPPGAPRDETAGPPLGDTARIFHEGGTINETYPSNAFGIVKKPRGDLSYKRTGPSLRRTDGVNLSSNNNGRASGSSSSSGIGRVNGRDSGTGLSWGVGPGGGAVAHSGAQHGGDDGGDGDDCGGRNDGGR